MQLIGKIELKKTIDFIQNSPTLFMCGKKNYSKFHTVDFNHFYAHALQTNSRRPQQNDLPVNKQFLASHVQRYILSMVRVEWIFSRQLSTK